MSDWLWNMHPIGWKQWDDYYARQRLESQASMLPEDLRAQMPYHPFRFEGCEARQQGSQYGGGQGLTWPDEIVISRAAYTNRNPAPGYDLHTELDGLGAKRCEDFVSLLKRYLSVQQRTAFYEPRRLEIFEARVKRLYRDTEDQGIIYMPGDSNIYRRIVE